MDVADWLRNLGLERYEAAFRENEIGASVLPDLTADDLKEIGVIPVGHRRQLLAAIAALQSGPPPAAVASSATPANPAPPGPGAAERRQLTVMFCDLVGSTALSTQVDPEDLRDLINRYHACCAEHVARFGGTVAKYMGDGVLAYFGYPAAHEDDPVRAIHAGLSILRAISAFPSGTGVAPQVRIGIATGLVVVGDLIGEGVARESNVVGETPNLAARLQSLADPGTVVIADATRQLAGRLFEYRDLGSVELKGFTGGARAWRVTGTAAIQSRFEALHAAMLTPLVGRDEELDLLSRRWRQAKTGEGRVVLISAEPGIGKSRLIEALVEHVAAEAPARLRYFCSPHNQDSAFYPIIAQLERQAGFARDDTLAAKHAKLAALPGGVDTAAGALPLLADLLSLPGPALDLSPQRKKELTFAALLDQLEAMARRQPVLIVFEDLHWIDPSTRELLDRAIARVEHLPVLLLATYRPEFQPSWSGQAHVTLLTLSRLGRRDGTALVRQLLTNAVALAPDVIDEIIARTDGVPLFLEEVTKVVLEDAVSATAGGSAAAFPGGRIEVPPTLQASLMARLDRLGHEAREIAQVGAAIGREFSYELLAAASPRAENETRAAVERLVAAELVFQRGVPPAAEYQFKHALVQDTAYGTLLRGPRQALHARIAAALETCSPEQVARKPELLARHFSEAQQPDRAVGYWRAAGERAFQRSANQEAIGHLTAGLAQLETLPDTAERTKQELSLQRLLGQAYFQVKGLAAAETGKAFSRARELCAATDDDLSILPVLQGIIVVEWGVGQFAKAQGTVDEFLRRARRSGDTAACIVADFNAGANSVQRGDPSRARLFFESGIALYRTIDTAAALRISHEYSIEMGAFINAYTGWCWWLLGYPDQAMVSSGEAIAIGDRVRHDYSRSRALYVKSILHAFRREWAMVEECANVSITLALERGLGMMVAVSRIMLTAARAMREPGEERVAELREAIAAYRATGTRLQSTYHLTLLAEVLCACGRHADGLAMLREAANLVDDSDERFVEAEVHRVIGDLLRAGNGPAESSYLKALEVARAQGARSFELRAANSLAHLWAGQGRCDEARDLLAPIHGWFTEGFDTADLREARELLNALG